MTWLHICSAGKALTSLVGVQGQCGTGSAKSTPKNEGAGVRESRCMASSKELTVGSLSSLVRIGASCLCGGCKRGRNKEPATESETPPHAELFLLPVRASVESCTSVACGAEFTMWLTEEGRLLSAGLPQYGQLGHGTDNEYNAKDCARAPPLHQALHAHSALQATLAAGWGAQLRCS